MTETTPLGLTIEDCQEVLQAAGADLTLMAGQAVSLWAYVYKKELALEKSVLSKDIDFWGDRATLTLLAKRLHTKPDYPDWRSFTVLSGIIRTSVAGRMVNIDVLHTVPGLDELNETKSTVLMPIFGSTISVLDPVSLIAAKFHNLKHFDQTERNDGPQLRLAIGAAHFFIADAFKTKGIRLGLDYCKRVLEIALIGSNKAVIKLHGLRIYDAIPIGTIREMSEDENLAVEGREKLKNFLNNRWARLLAEGAVS